VILVVAGSPLFPPALFLFNVAARGTLPLVNTYFPDTSFAKLKGKPFHAHNIKNTLSKAF
jgi:hypothetical protein